MTLPAFAPSVTELLQLFFLGQTQLAVRGHGALLMKTRPTESWQRGDIRWAE